MLQLQLQDSFQKPVGPCLRFPRALEETERDPEWLGRNNIDLDKVIATIMPWPVDPFGKAVING
jgi:hypothetical protein